MKDVIFKTVVQGSSIIFLDIPQDDFYYEYNNISIDAAKKLTKSYFREKDENRDFDIVDVRKDDYTNNVEITVKLDNSKRLSLV
ncbi:MAG: hypothetical protein ACERKV_11620 [Clostridiaceae bacterium]